METTFDNPERIATSQSVDASWRYFKKVWTASSRSEAWSYLKRSIEALPTWALVVGIVGLLALVANPVILLLPLAAGASLAAIYFTVKHAVRAALREHDRAQRH